jgi:hypothetical protein
VHTIPADGTKVAVSADDGSFSTTEGNWAIVGLCHERSAVDQASHTSALLVDCLPSSVFVDVSGEVIDCPQRGVPGLRNVDLEALV